LGTVSFLVLFFVKRVKILVYKNIIALDFIFAMKNGHSGHNFESFTFESGYFLGL
jgi:hypothetical protein